MFDDDIGRGATPAPGDPDAPLGDPSPLAGNPLQGARVVRVLPDVPAMDRALDYAVPEHLAGRVEVGMVVRVPLHGRRVRGWVLEVGVEPETTRDLLEVAKVTGLAFDAEVLDLARWAAWRWVGRLATLLSEATPERAVRAVSTRTPRHPDAQRVPRSDAQLAARASEMARRGPGAHLVTVSPVDDPATVVVAVAALGQTIVVVPRVGLVGRIAAALRRAGGTVAVTPGATAQSLAGDTVVGGRGAVWMPAPRLSAIVVIDEHDEALQSESSPTWHARELALERARRAGVPCLLVSPVPSLEARNAARAPGGSEETVPTRSRRAGWAQIVVADRREDDPRNGLFSPTLVNEVRAARRSGATVLCILNRVGRARVLACRSCGTLAECEACGAAVRSDGDDLSCPRCATVRPRVCLACGQHAMKVLRMGVTKAREDLEALLREPVEEVTASGSQGSVGGAGVVIGTVAALHRRPAGTAGGRGVGLVGFLDFDQELLAARYRSAEQALSLLVDASRVLGGRRGRILLQTRRPGHGVIEAARLADPARLSAGEWARRELLAMPPAAAVAAVGGEAAPEWIDRLRASPGSGSLEVVGPRDGWWLVRAPDPTNLADVAAAVARPRGRLRLRVDPINLPG